MWSSTLLDELGYLPFDKVGADLLFGIISQHYERCSLVVTTNRPNIIPEVAAGDVHGSRFWIFPAVTCLGREPVAGLG